MFFSNRDVLNLSEKIKNSTKDKIISSNDIIPKVELPYLDPDFSGRDISRFGSKRLKNYYDHLSFLGNIRSVALRCRNGGYSREFNQLAYDFGVILKIASYGVGECQENTYAAAWALIQQGYYQFAILQINGLENEYQKRKYSHCLIVLGEGIEEIKKDFLLEDFSKLNSSVVVLDPYLNYASVANEYVVRNFHYLSIFLYHSVANTIPGLTLFFLKNQIEQVIKKLDNQSDFKELTEYDRNYLGVGFGIEDLTACHETALISLLNEKSSLIFNWGHKNCIVYAYTLLERPEEFAEAERLNNHLKNGSYFYQSGGKRIFTLSDINVPESGVPQGITSLKSKK